MNIKKIFTTMMAASAILFTTAGYTNEDFSLADLKDYHKEFKSESLGACSSSSTKTYEDYRCITNTGSKQYKYIHEYMTVDPTTGFLVDEDGFIGVAMGYLFGEIGSRYYVELDTGITIPVVKVDAKAAAHATNGCSHDFDSSVIEFVIDESVALSYFGGSNGLASWGNFNNYDALKGKIVDIEAVSDERLEEGIVYDSGISDYKKTGEVGDQIEIVKGGY